jgi:cobalt-zinc-cadmium efflux system outer membrane protein
LLFTLRYFLKRLKFALLLMLAFCQLAIGTELAESTSPLTLDAALSYALRANPAIAVAERERQAIEGAKTQAAARPNPSISTSIQDTRSDNRQIYLQLNQEIELGNKSEARIEAADSYIKNPVRSLIAKKQKFTPMLFRLFMNC